MNALSNKIAESEHVYDMDSLSHATSVSGSGGGGSGSRDMNAATTAYNEAAPKSSTMRGNHNSNSRQIDNKLGMILDG